MQHSRQAELRPMSRKHESSFKQQARIATGVHKSTRFYKHRCMLIESSRPYRLFAALTSFRIQECHIRDPNDILGMCLLGGLV